MINGSERGISGVSGNSEDYKVTAEVDKNVSLENVSRNIAICEVSGPVGLGQSGGPLVDTRF